MLSCSSIYGPDFGGKENKTKCFEIKRLHFLYQYIQCDYYTRCVTPAAGRHGPNVWSGCTSSQASLSYDLYSFLISIIIGIILNSKVHFYCHENYAYSHALRIWRLICCLKYKVDIVGTVYLRMYVR